MKKNIRCYSYCLGLNYERYPKITKEQWKKADSNVIAKVILEDLKELKITSKIVDKTYIPNINEELLALRAGIKWLSEDIEYYLDYHVIIKKQDGYWYSKFGTLYPERLPKDIDIETWNWRDKKCNIPENRYNKSIVYIAIQI